MIWDIIKSIIYGIVEGITEWLPISSTGHLLIIERVFTKYVNTQIFTESFNEMFTVVIQLGAICGHLPILKNIQKKKNGTFGQRLS